MKRRLFAAILSLFLFTSNVHAGSYDIRDAIASLNITEKKLEYNEELDINLDGKISFEDCVMIMKRILNINSAAGEKLNAEINGKIFEIELSGTKAAEEFAALFPVTYNMSELNGNEKYIYTDTSFTAASQKVGHINAGDIMLYGDDCIVLFYESFDTPYSYTKIGHIKNTENLSQAVGKGSVSVKFSNTEK